LNDDQVPPGNLWSVGKEALAMLGSMRPSVAGYDTRLEAETQSIFSDANATAEDRRWAESYGDFPTPDR
jgi:hypothetical protein